MGFQLPRVAKCCFCVPLRIASLLIGYFSTITSCLVLSAVSFYTYKVTNDVETDKDQSNPEHPPDDVFKVALSLYLSFAFYMLVFVYNLVIHVMLVIGVHSNAPKYLTFYCNASYFLFVMAVALVVVSSVFIGFVETIPILIWTFTFIIFIIVVRSTRLEMEEQKKSRTLEIPKLYTPQRPPLYVRILLVCCSVRCLRKYVL